MEWTEKDRRIFTYHDGADLVHGDPLDIQMRLAVNLPDQAVVVAKIKDTSAAGADPARLFEAWQASERLWNAVREAFQMKEYDRTTGTGATNALCVAVWNEFQAFLSGLKKNGVTPPTSPPSTASPPAPSITPLTSA